MKTLAASALGIALALGSTAALAQQAPPAPPPPPSYEAPPGEPPAATGNGEWVQSAEYGWIWVPYTSEAVMVQSQPYTYFYTPSYGWTWYVSPWGAGRYHQGPWVRHAAYAPRVWHSNVWVAPQSRVVVRPRYAPPARVVVHGPPAHVVHGGPPAHRR